MIIGTAQGAKSGSTATVKINGVNTVCEVARDLTIATGDAVLVDRIGSMWFVVARAYTAAPADPGMGDSPPPPVSKPDVITGRLVVNPVETRTYDGAAWRTSTDDAIQGDPGNGALWRGCAFYGDKPATLTGATATAASVRIRRAPIGPYGALALTLWRVTEPSLPAGAPTLAASTAGPSLERGESVDFPVPTSWAQAMIDGTAGGLAVYDADGDPYVVTAGRGRWVAAYSLSIDWTR